MTGCHTILSFIRVSLWERLLLYLFFSFHIYKIWELLIVPHPPFMEILRRAMREPIKIQTQTRKTENACCERQIQSRQGRLKMWVESKVKPRKKVTRFKETHGCGLFSENQLCWAVRRITELYFQQGWQFCASQKNCTTT